MTFASLAYWDALIWIVKNFGVPFFFLVIVFALYAAFIFDENCILGLPPKKRISPLRAVVLDILLITGVGIILYMIAKGIWLMLS